MKWRVLLAGEGKTELGGWAGNPAYTDTRPLPGVLEALLSKVAPDGWEIAAAYEWKRLTRYRANEPRLDKDELNTKALRVLAGDHDCDLIVFSRDRDRVTGRAEAVNRGLSWLNEACSKAGMRIVGGMAHECTEAWVLAIRGETRSESHASPAAKKCLDDLGVTHTEGMVASIDAADFSKPPADAHSLRAWFKQAQTALAP